MIKVKDLLLEMVSDALARVEAFENTDEQWAEVENELKELKEEDFQKLRFMVQKKLAGGSSKAVGHTRPTDLPYP